jgi:hypothetical protein
MFNWSLVEIIGYVGSLIIAASTLMSSLIRLRWTLLIGNAVFIVYSIFIGSVPIAILNLFNLIVHAIFLYKIYHKKEYFYILEVRNDNYYLLKFLDFYKKDINHFFPYFTYQPDNKYICLLVLKNVTVAGVFIAEKKEENSLHMILDFATPEYRDFKLGHFLYVTKAQFFKCLGFDKVSTISLSRTHESYLKKMGFVEDNTTGERLFLKNF